MFGIYGWAVKMLRAGVWRLRRSCPVISYFVIDIGHPWLVRLLASGGLTFGTVWLSVYVLALLTNHAEGSAHLPSLSPADFSLGILLVAINAIPLFLFLQFYRPAPKPTHRVQEFINGAKKWWAENWGRFLTLMVFTFVLLLFFFWQYNLVAEIYEQLPPETLAGRLAEASVRDVQMAIGQVEQNPWILALPLLPLIIALVTSIPAAFLSLFFSPVLPGPHTERREVFSFVLGLFTSILAIFTISFFLLPRLDGEFLEEILSWFPLPEGWQGIDGTAFRSGADLDLREDFNALELVLTVLTASFAAYSSNQYLKSVFESIQQTFGDKRLKTVVDRMKLPVKSVVGGRQLSNDYPGMVEINASSTDSSLPHFPSDKNVARIRLQLGGNRHHDKSPWSNLGGLLETVGIDLGKSLVFVYSRAEQARDLVFYCTGAEFKALASSKDLDPEVCGERFIGDCLIEALADDDTRTLRNIVRGRRQAFDKRAGEYGLISTTYVKDSTPVREVLDIMGRERVDRVLVTSSSEPRELAIVGAAQLGSFLSRV